MDLNDPTLREELADIVGEHLHTALRKHVDSDEAWRAWKAIREMKSGEWSLVVQIAADGVLDLLKAREEEA